MKKRQVAEPSCKGKLLLCSKWDKCSIYASKINTFKLSVNLFIRFFPLSWDFLCTILFVQKMLEIFNIWGQVQYFFNFCLNLLIIFF